MSDKLVPISAAIVDREDVTSQRVLDLWLNTIPNPRTRDRYKRAGDLLLQWLDLHGVAHLGMLTAEALAAYSSELRQQAELRREEGRPHGLASSTVAGNLTAARQFLKFAFHAGACRLVPALVDAFAQAPKVPRHLDYTWLTTEEIERLLAAANSQRDYALLYVMIGTGVRVSELVAMRLRDFRSVEQDRVMLHIPEGKGNKARAFVIPDQVAKIVYRWAEASGRSFANPRDLDALLFPSRQGGGQMETSRVYQIVRWAGIRARIPKVLKPHALRHTFATHFMLRPGAQLHELQQNLGHARTETTLIYAHVAEQVSRARWEAGWLPAAPAEEQHS